eukprot:GHVU01058761.1.p1 GENE.GHVU01058761.1~~GHVU01058761.1.p1  ORF type:complete len:195 (+),score=30.65 GHVU01058761.1:148-732(+)
MSGVLVTDTRDFQDAVRVIFPQVPPATDILYRVTSTNPYASAGIRTTLEEGSKDIRRSRAEEERWRTHCRHVRTTGDFIHLEEAQGPAHGMHDAEMNDLFMDVAGKEVAARLLWDVQVPGSRVTPQAAKCVWEAMGSPSAGDFLNDFRLTTDRVIDLFHQERRLNGQDPTRQLILYNNVEAWEKRVYRQTLSRP